MLPQLSFPTEEEDRTPWPYLMLSISGVWLRLEEDRVSCPSAFQPLLLSRHDTARSFSLWGSTGQKEMTPWVMAILQVDVSVPIGLHSPSCP